LTLTGFITLLIILALLTPIAYELVFQQTHSLVDRPDCLSTDNKGLFGGWTHLRVHRVAFLQNFFFYLLIPIIPTIFKRKKLVTAAILAALTVFAFNPLYNTQPFDGDLNTKELLLNFKHSELTAPLFILKSAENWIEKGWNKDLLITLKEVRPLLSSSSKLVFVSYAKTQSISQRWFIYIFLDKNYKYVLKPKEFYNKFVYQYDYIISQPCITTKIPTNYVLIENKTGFCLLAKHSLKSKFEKDQPNNQS